MWGGAGAAMRGEEVKEIPADGLHRDVPAADYHAWQPAVSVSRTKTAGRSLLHYHYDETHPTDQTSAMALGSATHTGVLEPDLFDATYVKSPKFDMRTKVGKAAAAEFALENEGKERLTEPEYDLVMGMRDAVWAHPVAREMLSLSTRIIEASVVWTDEATGLRCKARPDCITMFDGWNHIVDLKTTKDASRDGFSRQLWSLKYFWQAAHYLDGCDAVAPASRAFTFLAVENSPPHAVAIYTLDESDVDQGRAELAKVMVAIADAERSNVWPGYPAEISEIHMPAWAQRSPE